MRRARDNRILNIIMLSTIIAIALGGIVFVSDYTGFATFNKEVTHEISNARTISQNTVIPIEFNESISSIKISGELIGNVKVYLKKGKTKYVIYHENESSNVTNLSVYLGNYNKTNESRIINLLEYQRNTDWDSNNDGIETTSGAIDFTVVNSNITNLSQDNIATIWNIFSIENGRTNTQCYGNVETCALAGLNSNSNDWKEPLYLYLGKYGATENNIVSVKIIYLDLSFVDSNIDYIESDWQDKQAIFNDVSISLNNECEETCSLKNFDSGLYKIVVEINNGSILNLSSISFSTLEDKLGFKYTTKFRKKDLQITFSSSSLHTFRMDSEIKYRTNRKNFNKKKDLTLTLPGYEEEEFYFSSNGQKYIANWTDDSIIIEFFNETILSNVTTLTNITNMTNKTNTSAVNISMNVTQNISLTNKTEIENVTQRVVIGQPVKWVKKAKITNRKVILKNIPTNLTVIINKTNISKTDVSIKVKGITKVLDDYEDDKKIEKLNKKIKDEKIIKNDKDKLEKEKNKLQRSVTTRKAIRNLQKIPTITGNFFKSITGNFVLENSTNETTLLFDATNEGDEVIIEYFTEPPEAFEENTTNGKKVVISSETHYENILAFAEIPNTPESSIKLEYIVNGTRQRVNFDGYDSDGDTLVDYIEWNVPHLSNATYEIIIITQAYHLDKNRNYISDIYYYVRNHDNIWSERIMNNQFVRVVFEVNLTRNRDITIYARSQNNAHVEVYEKDSDVIIADFGVIRDDKKYRILLSNLQSQEQDTFDLKITKGWVEFDYITDPKLKGFGETGAIMINDSLEWTWINFGIPYDSVPVILANPSSDNNSQFYGSGYPLVPLIKDVSTNGFNISMCVDGGATTCLSSAQQEIIHYFVFDVDAAAQYDWIEANTTANVATDGTKTAQSYSTSFAGIPEVWVQAQTYSQGGEIGAHGWVADTDKTTTDFDYIGCVHTGVGNTCDTDNPDETFGYVAIDISEENFSSEINFQAGSENIANSAWTAVSFSPAYTNPRIMVTQNDDDGGQDPEYPWARNVITTGADIRYCEADAALVCNSHNDEWTFWFAMEDGNYRPMITWNESSLDLGVVLMSAGNLSATTSVIAVTAHQSVNVTCVSGNCSYIVVNWTNERSLADGETVITEFECSNETEAVLFAVFNVTSANVTAENQINITCGFSSAATVIWSVSELIMGSVYDGNSLDMNSTFNVAGSNTNVLVTELAGTGTSFMLATPTSIGALGDTVKQIMFNCSPPNGQSSGEYWARYNVNSTEDPKGNNITVNCTVMKSYILWGDKSTLDIGSVYAGSTSNLATQVNSTGHNEQVLVTELGGTGSGFTSSDTSSIGVMENGDTQAVTFTCSPPENQGIGVYTTTYNVNSTYNATGDNITVSCTVLNQVIEFNESVINLTTILNGGDTTGALDITSSGINNNSFVYCISGDCNNITDDWVEGYNMSDTQTVRINFTCDDGTAGTHTASFRVNSSQNTTGDIVNVNCVIIQPYGKINVTLLKPVPFTNNEIIQNNTFVVNATVNCIGTADAVCGKVYGLVRDNSTSVFGDGSSGTLSVSSSNKIINNYTYIDVSVVAGNDMISVNDTSEFNEGDEIFIIQMQNGSGLCVAGTYEFRRIKTISGTDITLDVPIQNNYCYNNPNTVSTDCSETSGFDTSIAQIVKVPHYTSVTVTAGNSITAPAWNGYQGGIVMFRATGNTSIEGMINVSGLGFRGGQDGQGDDAEGGTGEGVTGWGYNPEAGDYPAGDWEVSGYCMQDQNGIGGAGSWCSNDNGGDPGAGGGYGTAGETVVQDQGESPSEGGDTIGTVNLEKVYFGGGGGAGSDNDNGDPEGDGGAGGGIVYITSRNISGTIYANGDGGHGTLTSTSTGIGGGGAGGSIWLRADNIFVGTITATGGAGFPDPDEPGGDGGDGRIRFDYLSISGSSTPASGYDGSREYMYPINNTSSPLYANTLLSECGFLFAGQSCYLNWTINASGPSDSIWNLDVLAFTNTSVFRNITNKTMINIIPTKPPDPIRFVIKNQTGQSVASIDQSGYLYLRGKSFENEVSLVPPQNSFIIQNSTGQYVAYINSIGNLFLVGTIIQSAAMVTNGSNVEFRNSTDNLVAFFDSKGNLKLKGYKNEYYTREW